MTQIETIISLPDIRYVEIHCPCGTKVTLDMEKPHALAEKYGAFTPKECPGCKNDYDSAVRPAVDGFQRAYHSLLAIPKNVTFRGVSSPVADGKV
jgi:hypothetical protein